LFDQFFIFAKLSVAQLPVVGAQKAAVAREAAASGGAAGCVTVPVSAPVSVTVPVSVTAGEAQEVTKVKHVPLTGREVVMTFLSPGDTAVDTPGYTPVKRARVESVSDESVSDESVSDESVSIENMSVQELEARRRNVQIYIDRIDVLLQLKSVSSATDMSDLHGSGEYGSDALLFGSRLCGVRL
jgi:hypothetical protein